MPEQHPEPAAISKAIVTALNKPYEEANRRAWANITRPVGADPLTEEDFARLASQDTSTADHSR